MFCEFCGKESEDDDRFLRILRQGDEPSVRPCPRPRPRPREGRGAAHGDDLCPRPREGRGAAHVMTSAAPPPPNRLHRERHRYRYRCA